MKKLDPLFRIAGEDGMLFNVSIVRSDNEGRAFRGCSALLYKGSSDSSKTGLSSSSNTVSLSLARAWSSPEKFREGFLMSTSWLGCLLTGCLGVWMTVPVETSRSLESPTDESRDLDGVEGFCVLESCSREGALRSRGLTMVGFAVWCRVSLDGEVRRPARGTGSLEGLGRPDGLFPLVDWFMMVGESARVGGIVFSS